MISALFLAGAVAGAAMAAPSAASPVNPPTVAVSVDSGRKLVSLRIGPFTVPAGGHQHHGPHAHSGLAPFMTFDWPTDGWLRGVSLRITDANGRELSRRMIHHINLVNLDRRQLLYRAPERTIALGQETEDIRLPATVGVPVSSGTGMGVVLAWHNPDPEPLEGVTVELMVEWLPTNSAPRPLDVLPVYIDVVDPVARPVDFDLPAGRQQFSAEFVMPINGRIIAAGGHLHDYGTGLTLDQVDDDGDIHNKVRLATRQDGDGKLLSVERKYPGIRGDGIRLVAGRRYRITGSYDNTSGAAIEKGAMVHLVLLLAPDHLADWPALNRDDPEFVRDLRYIEEGVYSTTLLTPTHLRSQ
ncbi:MAG TPA: hypothetical protein PLL69_07620 [Gemmatimonadales bacterium]|nr:hypothetical protein [Gemmatimonadales bacterium]